jgi:hypothetical protein
LIFFSAVCTPDNKSRNAVLHDLFVSRFSSYVGNEIDIAVDCNAVNACIGRLKGGKAPGCDGIMSEHMQFSQTIISHALSQLFRAMLVHGYVPQAFGISIVIPLLKKVCLDKTNMD